MAFFDQFGRAIRKVVAPLRPPNIAGPLLTGDRDRFGSEQAAVSAKQAQDARITAYQRWRSQGSSAGVWVRFIGFQQLARGRWIPVHSSNVSAIRWQPIDPYTSSTPEDLLAEGSIQGGPSRPWFADMLHVGPGHSSQTVMIKGRTIDVRDTNRIKSLLTKSEWRAYQERMLGAQPQRQEPPPLDQRWINSVLPSVRGRRLTEGSMGVLFVRFHDSRVYYYPRISLGEAMDSMRSPSPGRWVWDELRWAGKDYQQISGPGVKYRVGKGR